MKKLQYFENLKKDLNAQGREFGLHGMGGYGAITTHINDINGNLNNSLLNNSLVNGNNVNQIIHFQHHIIIIMVHHQI